MKTEYNLDISPKEDWLRSFPDILALYEENPLRTTFEKYENSANRFKKLYIRATYLALTLIGGSLLVGLGLWVFPELISGAKTVTFAAGGLGVLGIAIEVYMILFKVKEKWLLNRYGAERVRSFVASSFALGATASDKKELSAALNKFSVTCLSNLDADLNKGVAAFRSFSAVEALILPTAQKLENDKIFVQSKAAYEYFRVEYQQRFVEGELAKLEDHSRVQNFVSDIIFISGALLAVGSLLAFNIEGVISRIMIFVSATLFFLCAVLGIAGQGTSSKPHLARYKSLSLIHI